MRRRGEVEQRVDGERAEDDGPADDRPDAGLLGHVDVLACPRCGGRLSLLGTIEDPVAIRTILDSLAMPAEPLDRPPPAVTLEPAALATQV